MRRAQARGRAPLVEGRGERREDGLGTQRVPAVGGEPHLLAQRVDGKDGMRQDSLFDEPEVNLNADVRDVRGLCRDGCRELDRVPHDDVGLPGADRLLQLRERDAGIHAGEDFANGQGVHLLVRQTAKASPDGGEGRVAGMVERGVSQPFLLQGPAQLGGPGDEHLVLSRDERARIRQERRQVTGTARGREQDAHGVPRYGPLRGASTRGRAQPSRDG